MSVIKTSTLCSSSTLGQLALCPQAVRWLYYACCGRLSHFLLCRQPFGQWGRRRIGTASPVSMMCCTKSVCVHSSSQAAKRSALSVNKWFHWWHWERLSLPHLHWHSSWTALTVSTEGGADCGGGAWLTAAELLTPLAGCSGASCVVATRHWWASSHGPLSFSPSVELGGWSAQWAWPDVAWAMLTLAPQWTSRSRPTMQASSMSASYNSCRSSWLPTAMLTCLFPPHAHLLASHRLQLGVGRLPSRIR